MVKKYLLFAFGDIFIMENNIRQLIKSVSKMANRSIDKSQEDRIVKEILNNGVNENIFEML